MKVNIGRIVVWAIFFMVLALILLLNANRCSRAQELTVVVWWDMYDKTGVNSDVDSLRIYEVTIDTVVIDTVATLPVIAYKYELNMQPDNSRHYFVMTAIASARLDSVRESSFSNIASVYLKKPEGKPDPPESVKAGILQ